MHSWVVVHWVIPSRLRLKKRGLRFCWQEIIKANGFPRQGTNRAPRSRYDEHWQTRVIAKVRAAWGQGHEMKGPREYTDISSLTESLTSDSHASNVVDWIFYSYVSQHILQRFIPAKERDDWLCRAGPDLSIDLQWKGPVGHEGLFSHRKMWRYPRSPCEYKQANWITTAYQTGYFPWILGRTTEL